MTEIINNKKMNEKIKTYKIFEYLRVSTEKQNLDTQKNTNKNFLKKNLEYQLIKSFEEKAITGADNERPKLREMMSRLSEIEGIILYDWDRLSRDEEFAVSLMYTLRRRKIFVIESKSGMKLDFEDLQYRIKTFFDSVFASEERLMIKQRTIDGIKAYRKKYNRWGRPKYYGKTTSGKKISKEGFWDLYKFYRVEKKISKRGIARLLNMSTNNLYNKLNEEPELYKKLN